MANGKELCIDLGVRRVGEYGHFVMPIDQILDDVSAFLGTEDLNLIRAEAAGISRADMGVHPEEAMVLYALIRTLRPKIVLETGTFRGYSTTEIARALRKNGTGQLLTVDIDPHAGDLVPAELRPFVTFYRGMNSKVFGAQVLNNTACIDVFFHDSLHTYINTLGELIWFSPFFKPGSVIICHDAKMDFMPEFGVGRAIREFAQAVGLPFRVLDTTCGLAIMRWSETVSVEDVEKLRAMYEQRERKSRVRGLFHRVSNRVSRITGRR